MVKPTKPRKRGKPPGHIHDMPRVARILALAHIRGAKAAAEETGTSTANITHWKNALKDNEALQDAYAAEVKLQSGDWRRGLAGAATRATDALIELLDECRAARKAASDPEMALQIMTLERGIANNLLEHATGGESLMGPATQ